MSSTTRLVILPNLSKREPAGLIEQLGVSGSIEDVAFKNPDGSIAVLVYTRPTTPSDFSLNWKGKT